MRVLQGPQGPGDFTGIYDSNGMRQQLITFPFPRIGAVARRTVFGPGPPVLFEQPLQDREAATWGDAWRM